MVENDDADLAANSDVPADHQSRDNLVEGLFSSVKYLQSAHAETGFIKLRKSDKVTQVLLVVALLIVVAAQLMPQQRELCIVLADGLMLVILLSFIAVRFGVLRTLKPRQAVLAWQLILGSFLLGTYLAFNGKMIVLLFTGVSILPK